MDFAQQADFNLHLNKYPYRPCWITVSPAIWVTGNMASNMSLEDKEKGKERELIKHTCYYATLFHQFSELFAEFHAQIYSKHKTFCVGLALWERQQPSSLCKLDQQAEKAKETSMGTLGDPNTHSNTQRERGGEACTRHMNLNVYTTDFFVLIHIQPHTHYFYLVPS